MTATASARATRWLVAYLLPLPGICVLVRRTTGDPRVVLVAMGLLLVPALVYWLRTPVPETPAEERRGGWVGLAGLLALALAFRMVELERYPVLVDHDAGMNLAMADYLADRPWMPFMPEMGVGTETTFFYLMIGTSRLFGDSIWALRIPAVLIGMLTLVTLFLFARELFGRRVGHIAVLLAAVAPWTVLMSRVSKHSLLVPPLVCVTYVALLRALRRGGWWRYLAAGLLAGAGLYTYAAYRHGVVAAVLFVGLYAWCLRGTPDAPVGLRRGIAALLVGVGIMLIPLVGHGELLRTGWWEPLTQNTSLIGMTDEGGVARLADNALQVVFTTLWVRPAETLGVASVVSLMAVGALPLLGRRRDPRFLVLAWLLVAMILPVIGARYHLAAPRRYGGLLPVIFTLPALAIGVIWSRLTGWPRRAFGAWLMVTTIALALQTGRVLTEQPPPRDLDARRENILRAALDIAIERDLRVYLPAEYYQPKGLTTQVFFRDPRLGVLPGNDPLAIEPGGRDVLLIPDRTTVGEALGELIPEARRIDIRLPYTRPDRTTPGWLVGRETWEAARQARLAPRGQLRVPRDGRYRLIVPEDARGALRIAGRVVHVASGRADAVDLSLARGLVPYRFDLPGGAPPWAIKWTTPRDSRTLLPVAARSGWPVDRRSTTLASGPVRWLPVAFEPAGEIELPRQLAIDLALHDGGLVIADMDRVRRLGAGGPEPWPLSDAEGRPVAYEHAYRLILGRKVWSIAMTSKGQVVVSHLHDRSVRRFDADGRFVTRYAPPKGWQSPEDVAVAESFDVAVADSELGDVVVFDADGNVLTRHRVGRPTSVAWLGRELVVVDARSLSLVVIPPDGPVRRRFVGMVDPRTRVSVSPGGTIVLCHRHGIRLFDARLRLLAPAGDPAALDLRGGPGDLAAALWDDRVGQLWVLDHGGHIRQYRTVPAPAPPPPGIDIAAVAPIESNVQTEPDPRFGVGLAIDGGRHPAFATYRARSTRAGEHEVWVRYATEDPRPFALEIAGQTLRCEGANTGGHARDHLRWVRLGKVTLAAGEVRLKVRAERVFPHLARIRLVPVGE